MKKIILTLVCLLFASNSFATTYYLREGGTAANVAAATGPCGTQANTMSMTTHNAGGATISAGDIIKVCDDGGDFDSVDFVPPSAGSDPNYITYEAETGDTPVFTGRYWCVDLSSGLDWLKFDGLTFTAPTRNYTQTNDSDYLWFNDITFGQAGIAYSGFYLADGSDYVKITNSTFVDLTSATGTVYAWDDADCNNGTTLCEDAFINKEELFGATLECCDRESGRSDTILIGAGTNIGTLIEGNFFGTSSHSGISIGGTPTNNVIRNNVFMHMFHANVILAVGWYDDDRARVLIENNLVYGGGQWKLLNPVFRDRQEVMGHGLSLRGNSAIVRENVVIQNDTGLEIGPNSSARYANDNRVYNNTFYNNNSSIIVNGHTRTLSSPATKDNILKNNIIHWDSSSTDPVYLYGGCDGKDCSGCVYSCNGWWDQADKEVYSHGGNALFTHYQQHANSADIFDTNSWTTADDSFYFEFADDLLLEGAGGVVDLYTQFLSSNISAIPVFTKHITNTSIAFVEGGATDTITTSGDFVAAGFEIGDVVVVTGAGEIFNNYRFTLANVATGTLTLTATTDDVVDETAGENISIIEVSANLASGSNPTLVDGGAFLTTITTVSGSGTSFVVDDASYFYDGWSIPGETGDTIETSANEVTTITNINYTTNTITVNPSISWTVNDGVALSFNGTSPDIGASESLGTTVSISCSSYAVAVDGTSDCTFTCAEEVASSCDSLSVDYVESGATKNTHFTTDDANTNIVITDKDTPATVTYTNTNATGGNLNLVVTPTAGDDFSILAPLSRIIVLQSDPASPGVAAIGSGITASVGEGLTLTIP